MPSRPMSIRTKVEPNLSPDGQNARKEIELMPSIPHVPAAAAPLPPVHPAPLPPVSLPMVSTPVPVSAPSPPPPIPTSPPETQVDSNYTNSTFQGNF